jgi:hypothetical protein
MSTPWPAAIAPTVSPGATVYRLGSPAGSGESAGAGSGAGAAGAGSAAGGAGTGAASAAGAAACAATAATAPGSLWPAAPASVGDPAEALGDGGAAASATCAAAVAPPLRVAGGAASAPTPTAATTAAVAIPAHSLLLMTGRPVLRSVRGSSVAKLLLVPSGEGRKGCFMELAHLGSVQPGCAVAHRCAGRMENSLHRRLRQLPEPRAAQVGGIRIPRKCGTPREGRNVRKPPGGPASACWS